METLWFILVALMLTAYVVLDGFDLGAGIINLLVARNHDERRLILRAIGNVVRGVPLNSDGYFFEPLWTNFRVGTNPGILDWYTVLTGLLALVTLTVHGSHYIALKTEGSINARARRVAKFGWLALVLLTALSLIATVYVRPQILDNFRIRFWGLIIPGMVFGRT